MQGVAGACSVIMSNMFSLLCGADGLNEAVGLAREEGQEEAKSGKCTRPGRHEFISPRSCVRGTSSEPITAVTR